MAAVVGELLGQERTLRFVSDALNRVGKRETPPLLLILGPGGSGKTVFLDEIEEKHRKYRPMARLDLAEFTAASPADVMTEISRQLRPGAKSVGRISFPILDTGTAAIVTGNVTGKTAANHLDWYRRLFDEDDDLHTGSLDELRDQWHMALDEGDRKARLAVLSDLWRILCSGFLADLRKEFDTRTIWRDRRTTNCVLLLDNADTQNGTDFLNTLAACRQSAAGSSDPLLVIAAQRTLPTLRPPVGKPASSSDDQLSYSAWKETACDSGSPRSPWIPVRLARLSAEDAATITKSHALGTRRHDQRFVYELTAGHPAPVRQLSWELEETQASGRTRNLVTDAVDDALLGIIRPATMTDRELLAMAVYCQPRRPEPGAAAAAFRALEWDSVDELDVKNRFLDLMWASQDERGFRIDPLPRMLLTRFLARDGDLWNRAHQGFLAHFRPDEANDPVPVWYHRLALITGLPATDVEKAAEYLDNMLRRPSGSDAEGIDYGLARDGYLSAEEWDTMLTAITSAPTRFRRALDSPGGPRLHPDARDVVSQVAGISEPTDRRRIIARLTAALWLYNDRTFDPRHTLAGLISHEYQQLTRSVPGDCEAFFSRVDQFRDIADDWKDSR